MKTPDHFKRVVYIGMAVVIFLYLFVGLLGYSVYGDAVDASVTLNLEENFERVGASMWVVLILSLTLFKDCFPWSCKRCCLTSYSLFPHAELFSLQSCSMPTQYLHHSCCNSTSPWISWNHQSLKVSTGSKRSFIWSTDTQIITSCWTPLCCWSLGLHSSF